MRNAYNITRILVYSKITVFNSHLTKYLVKIAPIYLYVTQKHAQVLGYQFKCTSFLKCILIKY